MNLLGEENDIFDDDFLTSPANSLKNSVVQGATASFQTKVGRILAPNFPVDQWFQCLVEMSRMPSDLHNVVLEPLFSTEHMEKKMKLLAYAIRNSNDKMPDRKQASDIALRLINDGPEITYLDEKQGEEVETIMHVAARSGDTKILNHWISHVSKIPGMLARCLRRSNQGRTPLGLAVSEGHIGPVKLLIDHIESLDELGDRNIMLSSAVEKKQDEIFKTVLSKFPGLLQHDTKFLRSIIREGSLAAWEMVVELGIDSPLENMPDLLHEAIECRQVPMVETIITRQPRLAALENKKLGYPLLKNVHSLDDEDGSIPAEKIRKIMLPAILRDLDTSSVRQMFQDAKSKSKNGFHFL